VPADRRAEDQARLVAASIRRRRDAGAGEALEEGDDDRAGVPRSVFEQLSVPLPDLACNALVQASSRDGGRDLQRATVPLVRASLHEPLALERIDGAAHRALLEVKPAGELPQAEGTVAFHDLQGVALGDRDAVAVRSIAVPELIHLDQLRHRVVEGVGLPVESVHGGTLHAGSAQAASSAGERNFPGLVP